MIFLFLLPVKKSVEVKGNTRVEYMKNNIMMK